MHKYRTHTCEQLREEDVGKNVKLSGFVKTIRDLGSVIFVDLRDHFGVTQLVLNTPEMIDSFKKVTVESTICVDGEVVLRDETTINEKISTGKIEVRVENLEILGLAKNVLPFVVEDSRNVREDLRLEYRFLDLRNDSLHKKILFRAEVLKTLRDKMNEMGFVEIQTPILTSSSPEGARDFLVPSRLHPGEFYALPQAPQQYKQLLMMSGFDKYYQVAPCFRDEDPRADRSPGEFYQLDFEMSFATEEDILSVLEEIMKTVFTKHTKTKKISEDSFVKIPYKKSMDDYGIDKPDLRNPLIIKDATKIFENTEFKVFSGKTVKVIAAPCEKVTRKFFDEMVDFAKEEADMKGLAWIKLDENKEISGIIAKYLSEKEKDELLELTKASAGDGIFFIANSYDAACKEAGLIRIELGKRLDLIEQGVYKFCFIVDFPMYEKDDEGKIEFSHNPFSMPQGGLDVLLNKNPLDILAHQFDMVCNGYELVSGAVRNHSIDVMLKAFEIAGYTKEHIENKFGALFNAFQYGAPPHAGAAPGIDRMLMLLTDETNIREVIAFPKNSRARDLLMQAPSSVTKEQLKDVHIKLDIKEDK